MQLRLESLEMPMASSTSDGQPLMLPIDSIDEDPDQPRTEFDEESLRELAETIARRGVRQPISVRPHPDRPGRWILNFGARRLRASKLASKAEVPAFIDEAADSYDQVIENEQRRALRPLELAMFVKRRLARGETQAEIARLLGKSQPYIVHVSALIDAPHWLMELYRQGRCRGMIELYQLRRLHALASTHVEQWLAGRMTITRTDVLQLRDEVTAREASSPPESPARTTLALANTVPDSPPLALPRAPAAPSRATASLEPASSAKTSGTVVRRALFARRGADVVELVLSEVPADRDSIFIRPTPDAEARAVAAASLVLIGFLPIDGA